MVGNKPKKKININGYEYSRVMLTVGKDFKGEHIQKPFYGKTLSEANKKKDKYKEQIATGINPKLTRQSLSEAMFIWLWNVEFPSEIKSKTFERYEGIYRNYFQDSSIGKIVFEDITSLTIQTHLKGLFDEGYTHSQMRNFLKLLKKFMNYAVVEGYILKNPCIGVRIPTNEEEEIEEIFDDEFEDFDTFEKYEAFTEEELKKIFEYLTPDKKLRYIAMAAFFTGAREGELLALNEKNDYKNNKFKIYKTVGRVKTFTSPSEYHYEIKVTTPKTKKSRRLVPVNDVLTEELKQLKKLNSIERLKAGPAYLDKGLLFPTENGNYIDASNLLKQWKKALIAAGVEYKKFHTLRDTHASLLAKKGVSLATLAKLLGHSTTKQTEKYVHIDKDTKFEEVQKLNDVL